MIMEASKRKESKETAKLEHQIMLEIREIECACEATMSKREKEEHGTVIISIERHFRSAPHPRFLQHVSLGPQRRAHDY